MAALIQKVSHYTHFSQKLLSIPKAQELHKKIFSQAPLFNSLASYRVAQMSLSSISCLGAIHAIGLLSIGMAGTAVMTALLAGACAVGSYLIAQASTQKMFGAISEELQFHLFDMGHLNQELSKQNNTLQDQNKTLAHSLGRLSEEITLLSLEKEQYQKITGELKTVSENTALTQEEFKKHVDRMREQVAALETLKTQYLPEIIAIHTTNREQFESLHNLLKELGDPQTTLERWEKVKASIEQLESVTKKIQDAEKLLEERVQEMRTYHKIALEHQNAHRGILSEYKETLEKLQLTTPKLG